MIALRVPISATVGSCFHIRTRAPAGAGAAGSASLGAEVSRRDTAPLKLL